MNDYLLFAIIVLVACTVLVALAYAVFREGIAARLVVSNLAMAIVIAAVSFFLGKEGLAPLNVVVSVIIGTAALAGSSTFLYRTVARPMLEIADVAERIAEGDLRSLPEPASREDEVARMLNAVRTMVLRQRELIVRLKGDSQELERNAAEMAQIATETAGAAGEQASLTLEINATIEEVARVSGVSAERANEVRTNSEAAAERRHSWLGAVGQVDEEMKAIRVRISKLTEGVRRLRDDGARITEIAAFVEEIAGQSDLLAVNATIEAVRAGEHGRAFGVVAEQVRSLADRSKHAAGQIKEIVEENRSGTEGVVRAVEESVARTEQGRQAMVALGSLINELAQVLLTGAERSREIATAAREQARSVGDVSAQVQNLSAVGRKTAESAEIIDELVSRWRAMAERYVGLVADYKV